MLPPLSRIIDVPTPAPAPAPAPVSTHVLVSASALTTIAPVHAAVVDRKERAELGWNEFVGLGWVKITLGWISS